MNAQANAQIPLSRSQAPLGNAGGEALLRGFGCHTPDIGTRSRVSQPGVPKQSLGTRKSRCQVLQLLCCGGLLLALLGCSRSAVVVMPEEPARAEEAAVKKTVARGQADETEKNSFTFPEDAGGILLAKVLPPNAMEAVWPQRSEPSRRSSPSAFMKPPALPLPPSHAVPPRLPDGGKRTPLRPRLLLEETLDGLPDSPVLPQAPSLAAGVRVRVPSIDVNQPIPLPMLSQPAPERASLADPTQTASIAAALAAPIPSRTNKAPFLKLTLPDPYGRRRGEVALPEESNEFPLGSPQTPRR